MPLATLMTALALPSVAQAQSGPATTVEAPIDRARREAEKVYQLILLHADKPRKTREERVTATTPVAPRVALGAALVGSSTAKPPSAAAVTLLASPPAEPAVPATKATERAAAASTTPDAVTLKFQAETGESMSAELPVHSSLAAMVLAPVSVPVPKPAPPVPPAAERLLELVSSVEPDFPSYLVRKLGQGSVVVNFNVLPDGSVGTTAIVKSSHLGLNPAAQAAVAAWRFKPISATTAGTTELRFE